MPTTQNAFYRVQRKSVSQYGAGGLNSFSNEVLQAQKFLLAAAPGEYGFQNEPLDDHQFGVMIQGYKAILVGVENTAVGVYALGQSTPFSGGTANVAYFIAPPQESPSVDGPYFRLGSVTEPWTDGYFNHLRVTPAYALDTAYLQVADSGIDPSLDGAIQRNGAKLMWHNGTSAVDLSAVAPTAAPVGATYLVQTADATLTNEIAVGTTPNGELGGTWDAITVDTLHAGSYHARAGAQATSQSIDTTTVTNATGVKVSVFANETLAVTVVADITDTALATEGLRWAFSGPTGWGGRYAYELVSYTAGGATTSEAADRDIDATGTVIYAAPASTSVRLTITGRFTTSSTTGTLNFQFSKNSDLGASNITLLRGSIMTAVPA